MIEVSIRGFREVHTGLSVYTTYVIEVAEGTSVKVVDKRYSQFLELHKKIKEFTDDLPKFPRRSLMKNSTKVVEHRRNLLALYLKDLLKRGDRKINAITYGFLEIDENFATDTDEDGAAFRKVNFSQPTMQFGRDVCSEFFPTKSDIVCSGVRNAIYDESDEEKWYEK